MEKYLIGLIIYLILDILWIYINNKMYLKNIENIQKSKFKLNTYAAIFAYLIISLYLIFLIYNKFSLINCVLISFFIYSIYNLTNLATFKKYSIKVAIIDTIWGSFVSFVTMYIVYNYKYYLNFIKK
jgi:uncharacterized membrane protein